MSTKAAKDAALQNFRAITNATVADATRILKNNNYRVEAAVDDFYNDSLAMNNALKGSASSSADKKKAKEAADRLGKMFDEYKEEGTDEMDIEGTQEYFEALGLGLEDVVVLPLCYYLKAPAMGKFKREDFIKGWLLLDKADTIEKQKAAIETLRTEFEQDKPVRVDPAAAAAAAPARAAASSSAYGYGAGGSYSNGSSYNSYGGYGTTTSSASAAAAAPAASSTSSPGGLYAKTYEFTYAFGRREGQKSLDLDTALAFWDLILPHAPTFAKSGSASASGAKSGAAAAADGGRFTRGQLEMWKRYLREKTDGRAVSKDTWALFLEFTKEIDPSFQQHDEDGAWPSVIDDFVYWARDEIEAGRGPDAMEED